MAGYAALTYPAAPAILFMTQDQFLAAALSNPANRMIADELFRLALPDAWLVSGCLVQSVWNMQTNRPVDYGISDYDIFYFDPDTSWDAEDAVIRKLQARLGDLRVVIEARNQARVHLWYPQRTACPTRHYRVRPTVSTASSPRPHRSASAAPSTATTSMPRTDLTMSPA